MYKKAGLQPVSRPVEQVHYFGGWVEGSKSLWCQDLAGRQKWGCQMLNTGHKILQNPTCTCNNTDRQTDKQTERAIYVENLVELKEKTRLQSVLKGKLPTRSFFAF